jgi:transcriptional regulator with XRE-family HTH domain
MRRERNWTQEELASQADTKPTQITRVENPTYGSHTITTLRRIAAAFDVALVVRFVPFSELLNWDSGPRNMSPASFDEELEWASGRGHLQIADGE